MSYTALPRGAAYFSDPSLGAGKPTVYSSLMSVPTADINPSPVVHKGAYGSSPKVPDPRRRSFPSPGMNRSVLSNSPTAGGTDDGSPHFHGTGTGMYSGRRVESSPPIATRDTRRAHVVDPVYDETTQFSYLGVNEQAESTTQLTDDESNEIGVAIAKDLGGLSGIDQDNEPDSNEPDSNEPDSNIRDSPTEFQNAQQRLDNLSHQVRELQADLTAGRIPAAGVSLKPLSSPGSLSSIESMKTQLVETSEMAEAVKSKLDDFNVEVSTLASKFGDMSERVTVLKQGVDEIGEGVRHDVDQLSSHVSTLQSTVLEQIIPRQDDFGRISDEVVFRLNTQIERQNKINDTLTTRVTDLEERIAETRKTAQTDVRVLQEKLADLTVDILEQQRNGKEQSTRTDALTASVEDMKIKTVTTAQFQDEQQQLNQCLQKMLDELRSQIGSQEVEMTKVQEQASHLAGELLGFQTTTTETHTALDSTVTQHAQQMDHMTTSMKELKEKAHKELAGQIGRLATAAIVQEQKREELRESITDVSSNLDKVRTMVNEMQEITEVPNRLKALDIALQEVVSTQTKNVMTLGEYEVVHKQLATEQAARRVMNDEIIKLQTDLEQAEQSHKQMENLLTQRVHESRKQHEETQQLLLRQQQEFQEQFQEQLQLQQKLISDFQVGQTTENRAIKDEIGKRMLEAQQRMEKEVQNIPRLGQFSPPAPGSSARLNDLEAVVVKLQAELGNKHSLEEVIRKQNEIIRGLQAAPLAVQQQEAVTLSRLAKLEADVAKVCDALPSNESVEQRQRLLEELEERLQQVLFDQTHTPASTITQQQVAHKAATAGAKSASPTLRPTVPPINILGATTTATATTSLADNSARAASVGTGRNSVTIEECAASSAPSDALAAVDNISYSTRKSLEELEDNFTLMVKPPSPRYGESTISHPAGDDQGDSWNRFMAPSTPHTGVIPFYEDSYTAPSNGMYTMFVEDVPVKRAGKFKKDDMLILWEILEGLWQGKLTRSGDRSPDMLQSEIRKLEFVCEEFQALYSYTYQIPNQDRQLYHDLTSAMQPSSAEPSLLYLYKPWIWWLDKALAKLPSLPTAHVVYRGCLLPATLFQNQNHDVTWTAVSSSSTDPRVALHSLVSPPNNATKGTVFLISSKKAKDISIFSAIPSEAECLFGSNTRLTIGFVMPSTQLRCMGCDVDVVVLMDKEEYPLSTATKLSIPSHVNFLYNNFMSTYIIQRGLKIFPNRVPVPNLADGLADFFRPGECQVAVLFGKSGIGKTAFSLHLVSQLHVVNGLTKAVYVSLPQLDAKRRQTGGSVLDPNAILEYMMTEYNLTVNDMNAMSTGSLGGNIVLVLDGFDEILNGKQIKEREQSLNLLHLNGFMKWINTSILITCRYEMIERNDLDHNNIIMLFGYPPQVDITVWNLEPFNVLQIEEYITKWALMDTRMTTLGTLAQEEMLEQATALIKDRKEKIVHQIPGLQQLCTNPFVLKLSLPHIDQLYRVWQSADHWLCGVPPNISTYEVFGLAFYENVKQATTDIGLHYSVEICMEFGMKLALWMCQQNLSHAFDWEVTALKMVDPETDAEISQHTKESLLHVCPVEVRDKVVRFTHQSLAEFFIAMAVWQDVSLLQTVNVISPVIMEFLADRYLFSTKETQQTFQTELWALINEEGSTCAAGALSILHFCGAPLAGQDFSQADLGNALIRDAVLTGCQFRDCNMNGMDLTHAALDGADLRGADLTSVKLLCSQRQEPHAAAVNCVASSPDGRLMASASADNTIRIVNLLTNGLVRVLTGHTEPVNTLCWTTDLDGRMLISAGDDRSVRVWNTNTGEEISRHCVDSKMLCSALAGDESWLACGGTNGVSLWKLSTGPTLVKHKQLVGHQDVVSVCFSPSGKLLASASQAGGIWLWTPQTGDVVRKLVDEHSMTCVQFSPDSKLLACGCAVGSSVIWNMANGTVLHTLWGHSSDVTCMAFAPSSQHLVTGGADKKLKLWSMETGKCLHKFSGHDDKVNSVVFTPNSQSIISCGDANDRSVIVWPILPRYLEGRQHSGHCDWVFSTDYSSDGELIVTSGRDGRLLVWSAPTGFILQEILTRGGQAARCVKFTPGKRTVLAAEASAVVEWSLETGEIVSCVKCDNNNSKVSTPRGGGGGAAAGQQIFVSGVALVHDASMMAVGLNNGDIQLWHRTPEEQCESGWELICSITQEENKQQQFTAFARIAFSSDGQLLASGCASNILKVWRIKVEFVQGRIVPVLIHELKGHSECITAVAFHQKMIATSSGDMTVRIWDIDTKGEVVHKLQGTSMLECVAFSPDGSLVAAGGRDGAVAVWRVDNGDLVGLLTGHTGFVCNVGFSPCSQYLISSCEDMDCRIWTIHRHHGVATTEVRFSRLLGRIAFSCKNALISQTTKIPECLKSRFLQMGAVEEEEEPLT